MAWTQHSQGHKGGACARTARYLAITWPWPQDVPRGALGVMVGDDDVVKRGRSGLGGTLVEVPGVRQRAESFLLEWWNFFYSQLIFPGNLAARIQSLFPLIRLACFAVTIISFKTIWDPSSPPFLGLFCSPSCSCRSAASVPARCRPSFIRQRSAARVRRYNEAVCPCPRQCRREMLRRDETASQKIGDAFARWQRDTSWRFVTRASGTSHRFVCRGRIRLNKKKQKTRQTAAQIHGAHACKHPAARCVKTPVTNDEFVTV